MAGTIDQALNNLTLENGEDRISDLPESVLSHILSRLTTKEAVGTCVLSKKWEKMWTCIYNVHLDDNSLYSNQVTEKEKFRNFVQKVLHYCGNSRIESFTFVCSQKYNPSDFVEWISTALRHGGVRRLYIHCRNGRGTFPGLFSGSESLEEIRVLMPCVLKMSPISSFQNLKTLYITRVMFANENHSQSNELSFTFPVLEDFTMFCCVWTNVRVINIEAPRLSTFHMAWCRYGNGRDHSANCTIMISEGPLAKFKWAGYFLESFVFPSPPSVSEVVLDHIMEVNDYRQAGIGSSMLLSQFFTLTYLELSIDIVEAMDRAGEIASLPMFLQLISLKVESRFSGSNRALMNLLRRTPRLRFLDIHSSLTWKNDDFELIGTMPSCVMFRLEEVYFTYRFGTSIGLQLIKLLLRHGEVLQILQLCAPEIPNVPKAEIKMYLLVAPRASKNVVIEVI